MRTRRGHIALGLTFIVCGYVLVIASLRLEQVRTQTAPGDAASAASTVSAAITPPALAASAYPCDSAAGFARTAVGITTEGTRVRSATDAGSEGMALETGRAGEESAGGASASDGAGAVFQFLPGGAMMSQAELSRLQALAGIVAQHPDARVTVEGFPDRPGRDPLMATIAVHRARTGQAILVRAGVPEKRIAVATPRMDQPGNLAHAIRIIVEPTIPELETR